MTTCIKHGLHIHLVFWVLWVGKFKTFTFTYPAAGLDPSWMLALSNARANGWRFGTDILFTGGPLSMVYTRMFHEDSWLLVILCSILIVTFVSAACAKIARRAGLGIGAVSFAALLFGVMPSDPILIGVPLLLALCVLAFPTSWLFVIVGLISAAAATMAKFSVFPVLVAACVLLDIVAVASRRLPLHGLLGALSLLVVFTASGQSPADLLGYLSASLDTSAGYAAAMSMPGSGLEVSCWLFFATALGAIIISDTAPMISRHRSGRLEAAAIALIIALYLLIVAKAAFVRHDPTSHPLTAWGGLLLAALIYGALRSLRAAGKRRTRLALGLAAVTILPSHMVAQGDWIPSPRQIARQSLRPITIQLQQGAHWLTSPTSMVEGHRRNRERALAKIREDNPLPALDGSVDVIPSRQARVIANGLDYRPRPTLQEYTSYSARLIERNRRFFTGATAPDYLLMSPGSIDGRHPASAEGALWPLFLARYEPVEVTRDMVVMRRREEPLNGLVGESVETMTRFRQEIPLPAAGDPVIAWIDIRPTWLGRLLGLLFKPPSIRMIARYADGSRSEHRVVPGMIREGMVVSPVILNARDFTMLAIGGEYAYWRRPVAIELKAAYLESLFYRPELSVRLAPIARKPLRATAHNYDRLRAVAITYPGFASILDHNRIRAGFNIAGGTLLAHAPMQLELPVTPNSRLRLAFGMHNGSWYADGSTDGVCFAATTRDGSALFQRCLDPKNIPDDRGPQEVKVFIPEAVTHLSLETSCRGDCTHDWSYWQAAVPIR